MISGLTKNIPEKPPRIIPRKAAKEEMQRPQRFSAT